MLKALHTGDLHFSNKSDKLSEVVTTSDYLIEKATIDRPDVAIVAGDLVDEHDGPIRIDSDAARAAISFITRLGSICPIVIVRGTRSHDRETPYLFRHIRTEFPIYVGTQFEMVVMTSNNNFMSPGDVEEGTDIKAVFTLLPSPDKSNMIAAVGGDSVVSTTLKAKEALNDVLAMFGEVNAMFEGFPRIAVGHGMITGAQFSSGQTATGEDLEYCLSDFSLLNVDLVAFGHVHKYQSFNGYIFYSGSTGRLNLGEAEVKGFLSHELEGSNLVSTNFIQTPARTFVLYDTPWCEDDGYEKLMEQASLCEKECMGASVRFRYTIPEELRHLVGRDELYERFIAAGATSVKIEYTVIPKVRQRAAGISQLESLADKIRKWGETTGIVIPNRVLDVATTIEGRNAEELVDDARRHLACMPEEANSPSVLLDEDLPFDSEPSVSTNLVKEESTGQEAQTADGYDFQQSLFG